MTLRWDCLLSASLLCAAANAGTQVSQLRCEYLHEPLGVDAPHPRLSWVTTSDRRNGRQVAYQIVVSNNPTNLQSGSLWDSGKVLSNQSNQIPYNGKPLQPRQICWWRVRIWDQEGRATAWSRPSRWTVGLMNPSNWHAEWIGMEEPSQSEFATPRYLRRDFDVNKRIKKATLYVTALGLYEIRLNGHRVGDHLLAPEWTNYFKRVQYQTFDVTGLVHTGPNAVGAILGNGWYSGGWQKWQSKLSPIYGKEPALLAQLEIQTVDGATQTIATDNRWRGTTEGPIRFAGIYEGETIDANRSIDGWDRPKFRGDSWQSARIEHPRVGKVEWQRNEPIRITQTLRPVSVKQPKPGIYVFDLGQNIAGWARLELSEPRGTQVKLEFNEVLNPDGTVYMANLHAGHLSTGDRQIDRYTCRGATMEQFEPHFTYHGFRYVQVTGLTRAPSIGDLEGCVFHSGFTRSGSFACDSPLLNRLAQNIQWSQRANMMGVPTDCCQRDERCGYTGDAQFFMPTAVYNFDVAAFYSKWLTDVCEDSQNRDGSFADHAPTYGPGDNWNVGWSDAGIICPYTIWQTYGDTQVIREHYAAMQRNIAMLEQASPTFVHTRNVGNGDWLNLGGGASNGVIGTAYDAYDCRLMSEMAQAIGKASDSREYKSLADRFTDAFDRAFLNPEGGIKDSSQTGYALAFTMDLVPASLKAKLGLRFADEIRRFNNHLATGFIGTPRLLPALHLAGRDDLAYRLLLQDSFPSWLYQVKQGATTMWERWDGWTPEHGFQDDGMNSFNHYAFGSVGQYLFGMVGGIQSEAPGFAKIRIQPVIQPGLNWARTSYDSIQGRISCRWRKESNKVAVDVEIPFNTTATVILPGVVKQVGSGQYHFVTSLQAQH
ncbi:MAG: glycoside hydrolase family 78 protein [Fimbriimonas sp.]|nr:glycoside hydrolase family 78 protein [Fimbriimonas sp.]